MLRRSDSTEVYNNQISGRVYYGLHITGSEDRQGIDLSSKGNEFELNDMEGLEIKEPDHYSDGHIDGRMFTGSGERSTTAHVWLNKFSRDNIVKVKANETVIDEGENNSIITE
jgi:hypothetical protein